MSTQFRRSTEREIEAKSGWKWKPPRTVGVRRTRLLWKRKNGNRRRSRGRARERCTAVTVIAGQRCEAVDGCKAIEDTAGRGRSRAVGRRRWQRRRLHHLWCQVARRGGECRELHGRRGLRLRACRRRARRDRRLQGRELGSKTKNLLLETKDLYLIIERPLERLLGTRTWRRGWRRSGREGGHRCVVSTGDRGACTSAGARTRIRASRTKGRGGSAGRMASRFSGGRRWCSRDTEDVLGGEARVRRGNT